MHKHPGRYKPSTYARLILAISIFAIINLVFSKLLEKLIGNYDPISVIFITGILFFFAFIFTILLWAMDTKGTLGRLMGAGSEEN